MPSPHPGSSRPRGRGGEIRSRRRLPTPRPADTRPRGDRRPGERTVDPTEPHGVARRTGAVPEDVVDAVAVPVTDHRLDVGADRVISSPVRVAGAVGLVAEVPDGHLLGTRRVPDRCRRASCPFSLAGSRPQSGSPHRSGVVLQHDRLIGAAHPQRPPREPRRAVRGDPQRVVGSARGVPEDSSRQSPAKLPTSGTWGAELVRARSRTRRRKWLARARACRAQVGGVPEHVRRAVPVEVPDDRLVRPRTGIGT